MKFQFSEKEKKIHDAAFDCGIASNGLSFADRWMLAAKNGLTGINIPENFDGAGCTALETGIALEGFAEGCDDGGFTFSLAAHLLSGVIPVAYHASKKIQQHILPKVAAGNFILANAMTESASG